MALIGPQFVQIQQALLSGFSEATLRQMLRAELNVDLSHVAGGDNLTEIVHSLIDWADRNHQVLELIEAAVRTNPLKSELQALQDAAKTWHLDPPRGVEEPEPYKGLDFFDVSDADLFSGRNRLTAHLVAYLCEHPLLAVVGASGSGKSSLVRAGVVPALRMGKHLQPDDRHPSGSERWPIHIITPTANPLKELAASLTRDSESVTAQATLMDDLAADGRTLDLFVSRHLARLGQQENPPQRLLLIVDQFEELFTLCRSRDHQSAFVDNLLNAAAPDNKATVILTLRADFYAHCAQFDNLRQALESCQRYIGAMSEDELRQAIVEPATQGGWDLEQGLVDLLLADVAKEPGALPLLSHALRETWKRRSGRMLTFAGYQAAGRIQGAIARTADNTLKGFTPQQVKIARNIFLRLTELGEGVQDTRRRVLLDEMMPAPNVASDVLTVLQALQNARLVTTVRPDPRPTDGSEPVATDDAPTTRAVTYVDVAHEALIREWPTLREWLADDREGLRLHRQLTEAAQEWERLNHDSGMLYRGLRLEQVHAWAEEHPDEINEHERAFLNACLALAEAERAEQGKIEQERETARERELEAARALSVQETRARNRLRWGLAAVVLALVVSVGALWVIIQQNAELAAADADVRRQVATQWVQEGEAFARDGDFIAADEKFRQALALNPPPDTPIYVFVPAGEFVMGSTEADEDAFDDEFPQHRVNLDAYWIMRTEVTNAQYALCVDAGVCESPLNSRWDQASFARQPVTDVDWDQANIYAAWVGGRLPTEAEWEKACRGGIEIPTAPLVGWGAVQPNPHSDRIYPWGTDFDASLANTVETGLGTWADVGSYPKGASPYGVHDLAGNVWEWTSSEPKGYPYDETDGREDLDSDARRVLRGGSFFVDRRSVRCAYRGYLGPDSRLYFSGFRVLSPGY
jgi:formylglycine-generating enzyme required for sulfatase activity